MIIPYESLCNKPQKVEISSEAEHVCDLSLPIHHMLVERVVGSNGWKVIIIFDSVWAPKEHARRITEKKGMNILILCAWIKD